MLTYIDFAELREKYGILRVAEMLHLVMKRDGKDRYRGQCPLCDDARSFTITPSIERWGCFKCQKQNQDAIALVAAVHDVRMLEAAHMIVDHFETVPHKAEVSTVPTDKKGGPNRPTQKEPARQFGPLDYLVFSHPLLAANDLDEGLAEKLGIGFCPKGMMKGLIAIPLRLETGELVAYAGVSEMKLPKTFHFPDTNVVSFAPRKKA